MLISFGSFRAELHFLSATHVFLLAFSKTRFSSHLNVGRVTGVPFSFVLAVAVSVGAFTLGPRLHSMRLDLIHRRLSTTAKKKVLSECLRGSQRFVGIFHVILIYLDLLSFRLTMLWETFAW